MQICREFERFGKPLGVKVGNFFGGMDIKAQREMLKNEDKCPDIVVGTPGRIKQVCLQCNQQCLHQLPSAHPFGRVFSGLLIGSRPCCIL